MSMSRKGQIAIVLLVVMTLMLSAASLFIFYNAQQDTLPKLQSADSVFNLYKKADIVKFYVEDTLKEAVDESKGDSSKVQANFVAKFNKQLPELEYLLGDKTQPVLPPFPIFSEDTNSHKIKVTFKDTKILYRDPEKGITLAYSFDIEKEASTLMPLGA